MCVIGYIRMAEDITTIQNLLFIKTKNRADFPTSQPDLKMLGTGHSLIRIIPTKISFGRFANSL